jgi:hypothetical protein
MAAQRPDGGMIEFLLSFFDFFADRFSLRVRVGFFFELGFGVDLSATAWAFHEHALKRAERLATNRRGHRWQSPRAGCDR